MPVMLATQKMMRQTVRAVAAERASSNQPMTTKQSPTNETVTAK